MGSSVLNSKFRRIGWWTRRPQPNCRNTYYFIEELRLLSTLLLASEYIRLISSTCLSTWARSLIAWESHIPIKRRLVHHCSDRQHNGETHTTSLLNRLSIVIITSRARTRVCAYHATFTIPFASRARHHRVTHIHRSTFPRTFSLQRPFRSRATILSSHRTSHKHSTTTLILHRVCTTNLTSLN